MKLTEMTCSKCGATLRVEGNIARCDYCGNIVYLSDNDKKEHPSTVTIINNYNNYNNFSNNGSYEIKQKKKNTIWWILGWLIIFPVPITILLLRKKTLKPIIKYGLIALAWIAYLGMAFSGNRSSKNKESSISEISSNINVDNTIKEISFSKAEEINLKQGQSYTSGYISVKLKSGSKLDDNDIVLKSDDTSIATIKKTKVLNTIINYEVKAISSGETYIYASSYDGLVQSQKIKVIVPEPILINEIAINEIDSTLVVGDKQQLSFIINPSNADDTSLSWVSSDNSIVTVGQKGEIHAVGGGTATVTATSNNGVSSSIDITVDGTKRRMSLRVTNYRTDDNNIGEDWEYLFFLNGKYEKECIVSSGDILKCYAEITENDNNPDVGKATKTYTVKDKDLIDGFSVSFEVVVKENGGQHSGDKARFEVTFSFSPV